MPSDLPRWTLEGTAHEPLLVVHHRARIDAALQPVPAGAALAWLSRWLLDPRAAAVLREIHATLFGGLSLGSWGAEDTSVALRHDLGRAIEIGDLLVLEPRRDLVPVVPVGPDEPPPPRPAPGPPPELKTFVEIEVLDDDDRRFPTRVRVTLPDGSVRDMAFDGLVRIDGVDPGMCVIEFPDIDGGEWEPEA